MQIDSPKLMECKRLAPPDIKLIVVNEDSNSNEVLQRSAVRLQISQRILALSLYGNFSAYQGSELDNIALAEVWRNFPDIPAEFTFKASAVKLRAVGVFCKQTLSRGSMLGPYRGKEVTGEEEASNKEGLWEVYKDGCLDHYIDAKDPIYRNWMYHIQCARYKKEQNLAAIQHKDCLYFRALRDIDKDEELLVWYDHHQYTMYLGIPLQFNESVDEIRKENYEESEDPKMDCVLGDSEDEECSSLASSSENLEEIDMVDISEDNGVPCAISNETSVSTHILHTSPYAPHPLIYSPITANNLSMTAVPNRPSPSLAGHSVFTMFPPYTQVPTVPWLKSTANIHSCPPPSTPIFPVPVTWPPPPGGHTLHPIPPALASSNKTSNIEMFIRDIDGSRWQCRLCQRIFTSQGSLRAHARIHTGEKPYQCKFCQRTFTQASTLRSHERLHTGEKPYKCRSCGKAFTQSAGLRSHLKTHAPR